MSGAPRSRRRSLIVLLLVAVMLPRSYAAETRTATAEAEALEFLLASAAREFKSSAAHRPTAIRNTRFGFLPDSNGGYFVLCGSFSLMAGGKPNWTDFATVKTSDYEQWIGGAATSFCSQKAIKWHPGDKSAVLLQRLGR